MNFSGRGEPKTFIAGQKKNWPKEYFNFQLPTFEALLRDRPEEFWVKQAEQRALNLFRQASQRVPAYRDFLKHSKVNPQKIKTIADFRQLPVTDKENYIYKYSIKQRCWDGLLVQSGLMAMSSGTKGNPNYWPRAGYQEYEAAITHELLYKSLFRIDKYKSLLLIGFPMGVYVSGVATLLPSWLVAQKSYALTIASVGNNKSELLRVLQNLQEDFEQIILVGHPFFIKDVIETGKKVGIDWQRRRLKMMLCSEGFSEVWREYLEAEAGLKPRDLSVISTYGSSEMLLEAFETPFSIAARKLMYQQPRLTKTLTQTTEVPNFFQYNPLFRYVETVNKELIFTSASGSPLIRFNLHDQGQTFSHQEVREIFGKNIKKLDFDWQLPFLALWGRGDYTVIFYAANIYPQHIHAALNHRKFLGKITGKFSLHKVTRKNMDEFLELHVELRPKIKPTQRLKDELTLGTFESLKILNTEFADAVSRFGKKTIPIVKLWPYQHKKYFSPALKPKYIFSET